MTACNPPVQGRPGEGESVLRQLWIYHKSFHRRAVNESKHKDKYDEVKNRVSLFYILVKVIQRQLHDTSDRDDALIKFIYLNLACFFS